MQQIPGFRSNRSPSVGSNRSGYSQLERRIPHTFNVHSYTRPTVCQYCKKLLRGLFKQGVQCKDCQYNAHKKCIDKVPKDCPGEHEPTPSELNDSCVSGDSDTVYFKEDLDDSDTEESPSPHNASNDANYQAPEVILNGGIDDAEADASAGAQSSSAQIPLMRIVQSVKHTKRRSGQAIKEGWLVHFTSKDKTVKRHFWRLDSKSITLFASDSSSKYYKELPLTDMLAIEPARAAGSVHCFQLRTTNVDYFVGQDPLATYKVGQALLIPPPDSGIGAHLAKGWEVAIRQALMPVYNNRKFKTRDWWPHSTRRRPMCSAEV